MKLSIITINWNNREGLRQTMDNVLSQTARDQFEYVVVDGGADDGSGVMLEKEYDGKLDKWTSQPIKPIYRKMNMGVQMATGDYCLFLNSGDALNDPDVVKDVLPHLDGSHDMVIGTIFEGKSRTRVPDVITYLWMYKASIPHSAAFIRRELLLQRPYDENLVIVSDWKFFLQTLILDNVSYKLIDRDISYFDQTGISSTRPLQVEEERRKVLDELIPPRITLDYLQFTQGSGYQNMDYDRFYIKMRKYRYGKVLYKLNVLTMRFIALFRKGARFAREYKW
ncbi:MAG: glycosyltransferase [Bacteroidales bacterium]|nr:glycosyltransferase [Bacteroidales bacterium]